MLLMGLYITAHLLDAVLTYVGVNRLGLGAEGNPIVKWLMQNLGILPSLVVAKALGIGAGVWLYQHNSTSWLMFATVSIFVVAVVPWVIVLALGIDLK